MSDIKNVAIIAPHRDDEIYGCWSVIMEAIRGEIKLDVYFVTSGKHQDKRIPAYSMLNNINFISLNLFEDGRGDSVSTWDLAGVFDGIVQSHDVVYVNEDANHPDHHVVYTSLIGSLRPRNSLPKHLEVYSYTYSYIYLGTTYNYFKEIKPEDMRLKHEILMKLNELDNILKDNVNSLRNIMIMNELTGTFVGFQYADAFKVIRVY